MWSWLHVVAFYWSSGIRLDLPYHDPINDFNFLVTIPLKSPLFEIIFPQHSWMLRGNIGYQLSAMHHCRSLHLLLFTSAMCLVIPRTCSECNNWQTNTTAREVYSGLKMMWEMGRTLPTGTSMPTANVSAIGMKPIQIAHTSLHEHTIQKMNTSLPYH